MPTFFFAQENEEHFYGFPTWKEMDGPKLVKVATHYPNNKTSDPDQKPEITES